MNDFTIGPEDRTLAQQALTRWLDECEREGAAAFESGWSGYIGRVKLCAFVDDNGIALRIERSFSEDL